MLLGSTSAKAVRRTLMKLSQGEESRIRQIVYFKMKASTPQWFSNEFFHFLTFQLLVKFNSIYCKSACVRTCVGGCEYVCIFCVCMCVCVWMCECVRVFVCILARVLVCLRMNVSVCLLKSCSCLLIFLHKILKRFIEISSKVLQKNIFFNIYMYFSNLWLM